MYRIIFILLSLSKLSCFDKPTFTKSKEIPFPEGSQQYPYRFQFNADGEFIFSFYRFYEKSPSEQEIDPSLMHLNKDNKLVEFRTEKPLYSVMGFTINRKNKSYILDQGVVHSASTVDQNTSKIMVRDNGNEEIYNFTGIDLRYSILTDIVVDHEEKYAYITDGGIMNNNIPGLIVYDFHNKKSYKVLNNDDSFRQKQTINDDQNDILKNVGINSIQISCDDETIYYSSIGNKTLYYVSTKDISDAIEKFKKSNEKNDLDNIKVNKISLDFISYQTLISSKNNIFAINKETNDVELSLTIDGELSNYKKDKNQKIEYEKLGKDYSPISINVNDGKLYLLISNHKESGDGRKLIIYEAALNNDEFNNNVGCTIFIFKLYGTLIFIFVLVFIILCIAIMMIIANSGQKLEISNLKKEMEKEAEINELNRQLNE